MNVALWVEMPRPSIWRICKPESKSQREQRGTSLYYSLIQAFELMYQQHLPQWF